MDPAVRLRERCVEIAQRMVNHGHPSTVIDTAILLERYITTGNPREAAPPPPR